MSTVQKSKWLETLHASIIRPHRHILEKFYENEDDLADIIINRGMDTKCRRELLQSLDLTAQYVWGGISTDELFTTILLLDKEGNIIAEVGAIPRPPKARTWYRRNPKPYVELNFFETVGEALARLSPEDRKRVRYMLELEEKRLSLGF